jgi:hypothetical protein
MMTRADVGAVAVAPLASGVARDALVVVRCILMGSLFGAEV